MGKNIRFTDQLGRVFQGRVLSRSPRFVYVITDGGSRLNVPASRVIA
jgi:hypothetical protein